MRSSIPLVAMFLLLQCKSQQHSISQVSLENTRWRLVEVGGKTVSTPEGGREVFMQLIQEGNAGMLEGYAGCNGLGGGYQTEGRTIKFQPITTRMYCELQMDIETAFTGMLATADRYRIRGNTLELFLADKLLGKFEGVPNGNGN